MNSQDRIYKVSAELKRNVLDININPWKLLIETNRYYEIKPEKGQVKRLYKEKLNTIIDETKAYTNGFLYCSAFCTEDYIDDIHQDIIKNLQIQINAYVSDLQLNQRTIAEITASTEQGELAASPLTSSLL
jgi:hypothetical protein